MKNNLLCSFLLLLLLIPSYLSKTITKKTKLNGVKTEQTLIKFAFSPNSRGKFQATLTTTTFYTNENQIKLYFYNEDQWPLVKKAQTCRDKISHAIFSKDISFDPFKQIGEYKWRFDVEFPLENLDKPRYWYVTLADCSLEEYYHDNDVPTIKAKVTIWDEIEMPQISGPLGRGGKKLTHVPYDQRPMKGLHTFSLLYSVLLTFLLFTRLAFIHKNSGGEIHIASIFVLLAVLVNALSSCAAYLHLWVYESNGVGSYSLDCLSTHFEAMVDSITALLLLAISSGWTLPRSIQSAAGGTPFLLRGLRSATQFLSEDRVTLCFTFSIFAIHSILAQWGRTYNDDFDCYHDLEHLPGRILFFFRFLLGILFLRGTISLRYHVPARFQHFWTSFSLWGILWFLAIPCISFLVSGTLKTWRRHVVVAGGVMLMELLSLSGLTWLFYGGKGFSAFHRVSKVGGGGDGIGEEREEVVKFGRTKLRLD